MIQVNDENKGDRDLAFVLIKTEKLDETALTGDSEGSAMIFAILRYSLRMVIRTMDGIANIRRDPIRATAIQPTSPKDDRIGYVILPNR